MKIKLIAIAIASIAAITWYMSKDEAHRVNDGLLSVSVRPSASQAEGSVVAERVAENHNSTTADEGPKNSKASQVAKLVKAGDPLSSYAAYKMVRECLRAKDIAAQMSATTSEVARAWMEKEPSPEMVCGDITLGQISSRAQYVEIAAKAGVPGAAMDFLKEGPLGDPMLNLLAKTNDPIVAEWMARSRAYVKQAAENGELEAIANMSNFYQFTEPDHEQALRYFSAQMELTKNRPGHARAISNEEILRTLKNGLSEDEASRAIESGKKLANLTTKGEKS